MDDRPYTLPVMVAALAVTLLVNSVAILIVAMGR